MIICTYQCRECHEIFERTFPNNKISFLVGHKCGNVNFGKGIADLIDAQKNKK